MNGSTLRRFNRFLRQDRIVADYGPAPLAAQKLPKGSGIAIAATANPTTNTAPSAAIVATIFYR